MFDLGIRKKNQRVPPLPLFPYPPPPKKKGKQNISHSGAEELWSLALGGLSLFCFPYPRPACREKALELLSAEGESAREV